VTPEDRQIDDRLLRLERETRQLRPSRDFSARVMAAVHAEGAVGGLVGFARVARRVLPVAMLLAIGAVSWAIESERSADDALAVSYGALELDW
jgi:hypothetical protein